MNCDQFARRMQERLDDRVSLDQDPLLRGHAAVCDGCRAQLQTWQTIEQAITPVKVPLASRRQRLAQVAVAASVALLFGLTGYLRSDSQSLATTSDPARLRATASKLAATPSPASQPARLLLADLPTDASDDEKNEAALQLLMSISQRPWFDRTNSAMRSVRQGMAPLGRSLLQVVTIITHGDPSQTS